MFTSCLGNSPFNTKGKRYSSCLVLSLLLVAILVTSCASTKYNKIDFCWTTNHRIPPDERLISMHATPLSVKDALIEWTLLHNGEVVEETNDYDKIITLHHDSLKKFQMTHDIADKMWDSYDRNEYLKLENGEWEKLIQSSETQIEVAPSQQKGWNLLVKIGKREGNYTVQEKAGSEWVSPPGFFLNGRWVQPSPMLQTNYKTVTKTVTFYSMIRFCIFENEDKTFVYAYAYPEQEETHIKADYGNSVGYNWYKYVDALQETEFVRDAFNYLENL